MVRLENFFTKSSFSLPLDSMLFVYLSSRSLFIATAQAGMLSYVNPPFPDLSSSEMYLFSSASADLDSKNRLFVLLSISSIFFILLFSAVIATSARSFAAELMFTCILQCSASGVNVANWVCLWR